MSHGVDVDIKPIFDFNPSTDKIAARPETLPLKRKCSSDEFDIPESAPSSPSKSSSAPPPPLPRTVLSQSDPNLTSPTRLFRGKLSRYSFSSGASSFEYLYASNESRSDDPQSITEEERRKQIMLILFTEGDLFTLLKLLRDKDQPDKLNLDMELDEFGHTAVHWAASLGRMRILECLMSEGADMQKLNVHGETPLIRSVAVNNNFENHTFHQLLEVLNENIYAVDNKRHTILHHLAYLSSFPDKQITVRYYMDTLGDYLLTRENKFKVQIFVNAKDLTGDTALHVACRSGDVLTIESLLRMGARRDVKNLARKIPEECILPGYPDALKCFYPESEDEVCIVSF